MVPSTFVVVTISLFIVLCFALTPIVEVSKGITELDAKIVFKKMGIVKSVLNTSEHWEFTFDQEGSRMLPYALKVLASTGIHFKKDMPIGTVVNICGNGGGIFNLMGQLKELGYTDITIIVIFNAKNNQKQEERFDYLAFEDIRQKASFTLKELFLFEDPSNKGHTYHNYESVNLNKAIEKLKRTKVLFDGICGAGHEAESINGTEYYTKPYQSSPVLLEALKILPGVCPAKQHTEIKILSNATPSGRTEYGIWKDSSHEFVCYAILSMNFPFDTLQVDKPSTNASQGVVGPPLNILLAENTKEHPVTKKVDLFLSTMVGTHPDMATDIGKVRAAFTQAKSEWIEVVAA